MDASVARVLNAKFDRCLFEQPFIDEAIAINIPEQADEHAQRGAEE